VRQKCSRLDESVRSTWGGHIVIIVFFFERERRRQRQKEKDQKTKNYFQGKGNFW